jgi:anthranilate phosphoribosyltransferase
VLTDAGIQFAVIHDTAGYDEASLTGSNLLLSTQNSEYTLTAQSFGFQSKSAEELSGGGSLEASAQLLTDILSNNGTKAQTEVVLANASLALQVANPLFSIDQCLSMATESLQSGKALAALQHLIK